MFNDVSQQLSSHNTYNQCMNNTQEQVCSLWKQPCCSTIFEYSGCEGRCCSQTKRPLTKLSLLSEFEGNGPDMGHIVNNDLLPSSGQMAEA